MDGQGLIPCLVEGPKRYLGLGKHGRRYRCSRVAGHLDHHQRVTVLGALLCEWAIVNGQVVVFKVNDGQPHPPV